MTDNKTERTKSLEQLNEELTALKNVNNSIEEICAKLNETEKKEDRDFQTKLVKFQIEVQIWLAIGLALVALAGTFLIAESQVSDWRKNVFLILTLVMGILAIIMFLKGYYRLKKNKLVF